MWHWTALFYLLICSFNPRSIIISLGGSSLKCQSHTTAALFKTHTCASLVFVWQITLLSAHPLYTHTHRAVSPFKCKCHHTWMAARRCLHSNNRTWQRERGKDFSPSANEILVDVSDYTALPNDQKMHLHEALNDFRCKCLFQIRFQNTSRCIQSLTPVLIIWGDICKWLIIFLGEIVILGGSCVRAGIYALAQPYGIPLPVELGLF